MVIIGVGLAVLAAVLGLMAISHLTGDEGPRNVLAALTLVALGALVILGARAGGPWLVVVGVVEFVVLVALAPLARIALPRMQAAEAPELASSLAAFAAGPDSRLLLLGVYLDGSISASRAVEGDRLPRMGHYRLTGASCPHCFVEQQVRAILPEPEATSAVELYRSGTLRLLTMTVALSRSADSHRWTGKVNANMGAPNFDHACELHRPA